MPNKSEHPSYSMHFEEITFLAAVVGAGASAPTVPGASVVPLNDNFAASATRTSEGLYVITLREKFPAILNVIPVIWRSSGVLKHVNLVSKDTAAGTITVQVSLANGGGVDDIETTDLLCLTVHARKNNF